MRTINEAIVHASYTKPSMNIGAEWIRNIHVNENGWSDIGYHFVIRRDGTFERGRPLNKMGAHCKGRNRNTIGICLVGGISENNLPENNFTEAQFKQLKQTIGFLQNFFPELKKISGHRDYDKKKACPCFDVAAVVPTATGPTVPPAAPSERPVPLKKGGQTPRSGVGGSANAGNISKQPKTTYHENT